MQKQDLGFRCARRCRTGMLCPQSTRAQTQPCMGTSQGRCKFPRKHHCFQATCLARTGISPLVPHLGSRAWPVRPHLSARCDGVVIHGGDGAPADRETSTPRSCWVGNAALPLHACSRAGMGPRELPCAARQGRGQEVDAGFWGAGCGVLGTRCRYGSRCRAGRQTQDMGCRVRM